MNPLPTPEVIELGNADISRPEPWQPWSGPKESAPLPGHEHLADITNLSEALAFVAFWPCIGLIAWMAIDPYGFRDALLRALAWLS